MGEAKRRRAYFQKQGLEFVPLRQKVVRFVRQNKILSFKPKPKPVEGYAHHIGIARPVAPPTFFQKLWGIVRCFLKYFNIVK